MRRGALTPVSFESGARRATMNIVVEGSMAGLSANDRDKPASFTDFMLKRLRVAQEAALVVGAATPVGMGTSHLQVFRTDVLGMIRLIRGRSS